MMNIDDALRIVPDEIRRQDLHVARKHDEIDAVFSQKLQLLPLGFGFVIFRDGDDTVGNAVKLCVALGIRVVADNHRDVTGQLSCTLPIQQVYQTVVMFRNKNSYSRPIARERDPPLHRKPLGGRRELLRKILQVKLKPIQVPFDSSQIELLFDRLVLLKIQNVALVPAYEVRDRGIQSFPVWTLNQQNGGLSQVLYPRSDGIIGSRCEPLLLLSEVFLLCIILYATSTARKLPRALPAIPSIFVYGRGSCSASLQTLDSSQPALGLAKKIRHRILSDDRPIKIRLVALRVKCIWSV